MGRKVSGEARKVVGPSLPGDRLVFSLSAMASKLRRPQLFTYTDGRRCLTSYPQYPTAPKPTSGSQPSQSPPALPPKDYLKKQPKLYNMEVGVASSYNGVMRNGSEVGERSPGKGLHVNFTEKGEVKERREKFLTAKYGSHQMSLIRKRLAVEMWLYDELQKLYESTDQSNTEVEVDIDELLDMDDDNQRRRHLQELLCDAKKSPHDVKKFVNDLLERTKTL